MLLKHWMLPAFCKRSRPNRHHISPENSVPMFHPDRVYAWTAVIGLVLTATALALVFWYKQLPLSIRGAVMVQDSDPRNQSPIAGVVVSADKDLAPSACVSDSSGFFVLTLRKIIRRGHPITLHFSRSQYRPLELKDFVQDKLYIVHLIPSSGAAIPQGQPLVKVTNVRVRYTFEAMTALNVGSEVKTFEIQNKGNIPCKGQHPCSPDGQWKAALGSGSLDAGPGNEFRDARASCIAGPCPFTRIESDDFAREGQTITVSARDWSDTATFLLEAEVFRPMVSQTVHWSYPVVFGDGFSFTLPTGAEGESIEADLDGQTIIFPLGPSLLLSWATCDRGGGQGKARVYRCTLKPGYQFK
jgi:hypothetical protein